jgi:hypothetical protein
MAKNIVNGRIVKCTRLFEYYRQCASCTLTDICNVIGMDENNDMNELCELQRQSAVRQAKLEELEAEVNRLKSSFNPDYLNAKNMAPIIRQQALAEAAKVYEPYIKLLSDELESMITIASAHGWQSTRYEQGVKCREAIAKLHESMETRSSNKVSSTKTVSTS